MNLLGLINIPNWLAISFIVLAFLYIYLTRNDGVFQSMGISGPKPWPVLGNMLPEFKRYVLDLDLEYARKYGKVYGVFEARTPTLRVADPEIIREICVKEFSSFTDHRSFEMGSMDPIFTLFLTVLKGEQWKQTRNVMTPSFTSGKLKLMAPLIEKCCQELTANFSEMASKGESFELKPKLVNYLLDVIASCAFGMDVNAQKNPDDVFGKYVKKFMANDKYFLLILFLILPDAILKRISLPLVDKEATNFFKKVLADIIQFRQTTHERRNDFLQLMLDALNEVDQKKSTTGNSNDEHNDAEDSSIDKEAIKKVLTPNGVLAQSLLFLVAGFETVATAMSFLCYLLANNPECQDKLLKEIDEVLAKNEGKITYDTVLQMRYMDMVISETLRMYPPAMRTDRQCNRACKVKDIVIPKGMVVTLCISTIHNNEEYYPNPKKFDPERFSNENKEARNPFTYLPFGVGPRNCIGMRFALMNMKISLTNILKEFRFVCAPETEVPIKFKTGIPAFVPLNGIWLKLEKRFH